jgi:soluble P-type ATPase
MIDVSIPGFGQYQFGHLVLDYNGTLAIDGRLIPLVREKLTVIGRRIEVHVLTADTFGSAASELHGLPCKLKVISQEFQDIAKQEYVTSLGADSCICIGNGRNDRKMFGVAPLSIAVIQKEGASSETLASAKIVCGNIIDAFDLLENSKRLMATLRC